MKYPQQVDGCAPAAGFALGRFSILLNEPVRGLRAVLRCFAADILLVLIAGL